MSNSSILPFATTIPTPAGFKDALPVPCDSLPGGRAAPPKECRLAKLCPKAQGV